MECRMKRLENGLYEVTVKVDGEVMYQIIATLEDAAAFIEKVRSN